LFYFCWLNYQYYGNSHTLVPFGTRLSVAREVAEYPSAAGGRYSEGVQAQRSILCERSVRAYKIGNRKEKHDKHLCTHQAQHEEPEKSIDFVGAFFNEICLRQVK